MLILSVVLVLVVVQVPSPGSPVVQSRSVPAGSQVTGGNTELKIPTSPIIMVLLVLYSWYSRYSRYSWTCTPGTPVVGQSGRLRVSDSLGCRRPTAPDCIF